MEATIQDTINEVFQESESVYNTQRTRDLIKIGSDDYLDIVNEQTEKFNRFSGKLKSLNENLIIDLNRDSQMIYSLCDQLKGLHSNCLQTQILLEKSAFAPAMAGAIEYLRGELLLMKEIIADTMKVHITMKSNEKLQSLFSRL